MTMLAFKLNERLYLRDPQSTELGQKLISEGVEMIDRLGFENFTFKKLAEQVGCTEASVYRYFENKQRLLQYLVAWYWSWIDYRLDLFTTGETDPVKKLRACLRVLAEEKKFDPSFQYINEEALHRIVVGELDKTYLTKSVDEHNKEGVFGGFKRVCRRLSDLLVQIDPKIEYPRALISTLLLASWQQLFFAQHLPSITEIQASGNPYDGLFQFFEQTVFRILDTPKK
jgi:AcrR family transcriptional regulator